MSALIFVLLGANHRSEPANSTPLIQPLGSVFQAPPTDCEAPPTAKPGVVRQTSIGRNRTPPGGEDNRSAVDSEAEYGSVSEFIEPMSDSRGVIRPVSMSLNTDRDLHLAQLMESIL